ncbi:hypothetical protein B7P43_G07645 [Cryptotermes secundus]|uniref:Uncharacterized protein n=1 Tax=Cryptotermes secundus TaxID=105785 RepID=A0A2J7R2X8_9NEOP|nr:hypothetical protein B7P43_G07645 [Cryptotermes secundus]
MIAYSLTWPISNLCQQAIRGNKEWDFAEALRFCLYGSCFVAPTLHGWLRLAANMWPELNFKSAIAKYSEHLHFHNLLWLLVADRSTPWDIGVVAKNFDFYAQQFRNVGICLKLIRAVVGSLTAEKSPLHLIAAYLYVYGHEIHYCLQALVEQICYTPFAMVCFFFIMTLLEGKTIGEASTEVKVKFFPTYQNGQETLEDEQSSGRPSTSRTEEIIGKVRQLIRYDQRMTITELEQEVGTVTGHFYDQVLQRLCDAVRRKWCDKWQGQWLLHHDNAPSHTLLVVGACVWPVVQTINYTVVSEKNRVPFVGICSLLWTCFLAYMKQLEAQKLAKIQETRKLGTEQRASTHSTYVILVQ